ncbi:ankyrin repeat domain-containing protein [Mannheimia sp. ZY171111]|uniref:ankyrin repeat domain-containing protein n=2 Tax=Mannheimia TaxID=75984 RepID=UPI001ADD9B2E|nr:ankyrin repeat domain-containing protein [Mannheimia sp. ZY171111]QTM00728.1 ankyrin repeat domain-containing protein [Mannheimia sp. ZY171111]
MDKYTTLGVNILEAIATDDFELLEELFRTGERNYLEISPKEGWSWLHKSLLGFESEEPSRKMIEHLISKGLDVNAQDCYGMTPLHYAMRSRNVEAAIALLNAGADPNIPNQDNLIPLSMIGYLPDRLDILELMLKKGANVHFLVNKNESILESYKPTSSEPHLIPIYELMMKYS